MTAACRAHPPRPALFVDKDGTLIEDVPWNVDPARVVFQPGATEALAALADAGFAIVVVTNQAGLALGRFDITAFARLRVALEARILGEAGVALAGFEWCPHAPGADGRPVCACRKPAPGMLLRAALRHGLDLERSWIVGDTLDDIEAGHRVGCRAVLFGRHGETQWRPGALRRPDAWVEAWDEVVHTVLGAQLAPAEAAVGAAR